MSKEYKFTFKKDDIYVEFDTTDKEALSRQFQIWVTCASVYTYQHKRLEEQSQEEISTETKNIQTQVEPIVIPIEKAQISSEEKGKTINDLQNPPKEEFLTEEITQVEKPINHDFEYFMDKQSSLEEKKQEIVQTVEQAGEISSHLDNLYHTDSRNLNSLETFKEKLEDEDEFFNKTADFDKILELSMSNSTPTETEIKKDDRFLKILNVKNVNNKLEYLIVTAYYLSEFEKLDKFTLKLINAKLMQNIKEAVDHNVLQEAIDKGLVEILPSLPDIANSVEYRLTNAGEEAFLNGTSL